MSNFNCEHCGAACIDSPRGYVTGCEHYPAEGTTMKTATKEKPILFSGAMVRAIIDGRKTVTRRVVKHQPPNCVIGETRFPWATFYDNGIVHTWGRNGTGGENWNANDFPAEDKFNEALKRTPYERPCPYGQPGDRLWVREAFDWVAGSDTVIKLGARREGKRFEHIRYRADGCRPISGKWAPSIHMPRWASRLTLEIVSVRVERIQQITEADVLAEGLRCGMANHDGSPYDWKAHFASTWDTLNKKRGYGWDSNPWVWRIEFRRLP